MSNNTQRRIQETITKTKSIMPNQVYTITSCLKNKVP